MHMLLLLGLVNVGAGITLNVQTIDKGHLDGKPEGKPDAMDRRALYGLGGLGLATLGAFTGMPFLVAMGLGTASASYVNRDATARVERGLKDYIKAQADQALVTTPPPRQLPGPASEPETPLDRFREFANRYAPALVDAPT